MRYLFSIILILVVAFNLEAQTVTEPLQGSVTYVTSQNVYVKFSSTEGIASGDTLFIQKDNSLIPSLVVKDLSSISCVCVRISNLKFAVTDKVLSTKIRVPEKKAVVIAIVPAQAPTLVPQDSSTAQNTTTAPTLKQHINGRISLGANTGFSSTSFSTYRTRFTFSMNAQNIGNSRLSAETYIVFTNKDKEWTQTGYNVFTGLKIYSLAAIYDAGKNSRIVLGRKINPKISSMGAVDGLQYEVKLKSISIGAIAGTRPDYTDYGFNAKLLQYGAYLSHDANTKNGSIQSSLAFIEQKNSGKTDRRFVYLQHSNNLLPKLNFFGSMEIDLYKVVDSVQSNSPSLTNLYLSLRYRLNKKLSFSASYTNRQNIIYYESYKSMLDQMLAEQATQGYQLQINFRPINKLSVGLNGGYRFQKKDPKPSKNLYGYVTYSSIPGLNASATLSVNWLETTYLAGKIYSLGLSRDFLKGKLYGNIGYKYVDYVYNSSDYKVKQNVGELGLSWRIYKKLSFSMNYEGTFEKDLNYSQIYGQLSQSF
jgi:hypothetical protein